MADHSSVLRLSGLDHDAVADSLNALNASMRFQWPVLWACCRRRIRRWPRPPRWSATDWWDEAYAQGVASACQALHDFDATRGHPLHRFVRWRVLAGVWTLYRRERSYSAHCVVHDALDQFAHPCIGSYDALNEHDAVRVALAQLPDSHLRLIENLFWKDESESAIATARGVSQQAVSKQKRLVFKHLQPLLAEFRDPREDPGL